MVIKEMVHITPYHLDRMLHIYLPDDYEESEARYPVMYMYDGHNLFYNEDATYGKSWGLQEFMRQWENQLIIVGIECNHEGNKRLEEFSPYDFRDFDGQRIHGTGKVFMQWVVDELKPLIDTHFRTKPEREYTGIGGSSMGGLMAYYTVVAHNDVFSKAACLSSAVGFCYDAMREELTSAGPLLPDTRVYMSWGSKESGRKPGLVKYTCTNLEFSHLLVERGAVTYPYLQAFGGHCEADWEKQNAIYMPFLWNGVFEDGME
ncbi:MAG: alpha/beta hydrolase [Coprococcus catus]|nr:alpha/beta hydrolase [Coprococcus catus]